MNKRKNIALFAPSIGFGGTERVVGRFANSLIKYYNVHLIVMYNSIDLPIDEKVKIISLSNKEEHFNNSQTSKFFHFFKSILKYRKIIKQHEIEISISFLARQNILNGIVKMLQPKLKTIISERCYPSNTYGSFGKNLIKYFYNKNDCLFSNSIHINTDLQANFHLKIPTHVIYNPIYTLGIKPSFTTFEKQKDAFKIIAVGRLNPVKNHKSLIKSMLLLNNTYQLNIYGIGALEEELKLLTKKLNLINTINFKGNSNTINTEILAHHCLVLTSLSEGFPNVILESMSLGVPVIATNCMSGPLELLHDNEAIEIEKGSFKKAKYGLLVNINDEKGLAEAIKFYQNNEEERKKYSELSFQKAMKFDISKIELQLKNLIDTTLCVE